MERALRFYPAGPGTRFIAPGGEHPPHTPTRTPAVPGASFAEPQSGLNPKLSVNSSAPCLALGSAGPRPPDLQALPSTAGLTAQILVTCHVPPAPPGPAGPTAPGARDRPALLCACAWPRAAGRGPSWALRREGGARGAGTDAGRCGDAPARGARGSGAELVRRRSGTLTPASPHPGPPERTPPGPPCASAPRRPAGAAPHPHPSRPLSQRVLPKG